MRNILTIAGLTIREGQRRRILWVAVIMALAFLILFGLGVHLIFNEIEGAGDFLPAEQRDIPGNFLIMVGLYVTNFLVVIMAILVSVATISNEIDTHVIDTIVTKPISRLEVVLGKWLGFAVMITAYCLLLAGGVILIGSLRTGLRLNDIVPGLALMSLNGLVAMTISIAGGTRFSTLANGILGFMLYGIAFIGGWVETLGALLRNATAVDLGIVASLLMPTEVLFKRAALFFQPRMLNNPEFAGPFAVTSEPSPLMIAYAGVYIFLLLLFALWSFSARDL